MKLRGINRQLTSVSLANFSYSQATGQFLRSKLRGTNPEEIRENSLKSIAQF
jgi:hypothetical protein